MKHLILTVFYTTVLLTASVAGAQVYQWKDASGTTIFSDRPPVDQQVTNVRRGSSAPAEGSGTPPQRTLADRDMESRQRQQETQKRAEKEEKEEKAAAAKREQCTHNRRYLSMLESGQRMALMDDKGERYFMDDDRRSEEISKTREAMGSCEEE